MKSSNKGRYLLLGVLVLIIMLIVMISKSFFNEPKTDVQAVETRQLGNISNSASVLRPSTPLDSKETNSQPQPNGAASSHLTDRETKLRTAVQEQNVPIEFWGRVIDQEGMPLGGVVVRSRVRQWQVNAASQAGTIFPKSSTTTDSGGNFEVRGGNGDVLTIDSLEKEGYEVEPGDLRSFGFNTSENVSVSPGRPIVFRMWKSGIKEALVVGDKLFKVIPDGHVCTINLLEGTISDSDKKEGDFEFWIKRPTGAKVGQRFDWSFEIRPIKGGIQEQAEKSSSMFLAPADGYMESYLSEHLASDKGWGDSVRNMRLFIATRDSKIFGRIVVEVYSVYEQTDPTARIRIKYAVNPSGSRILK